jgi:hypothetical protein
MVYVEFFEKEAMLSIRHKKNGASSKKRAHQIKL